MKVEVRKLGYRNSVKLECKDKSRTKQSFVQETLIQNILRKYRQTGVISHSNQNPVQHGDFIGSMDYKSSLDRIAEVEEEFASLDADTRKKYENDPLVFLEAVEDGTFEVYQEPIQLELEDAIEASQESEPKGEEKPAAAD
jgi:phage internal scaffolding protein